jgi:phytoene dehydrogenase-like protein
VLVRVGDSFQRQEGPSPGPLAFSKSLLNPVGSIRDQVRLHKFRWALEQGDVEDQSRFDERPALDLLRWNGRFSALMIDRYFRPLFGAFFSTRDLATSSRAFRFLFRVHMNGAMAVPALGMEAIARQIASGLPSDCVRLSAAVEKLGERQATLQSGETLQPRAVVVATDAAGAARLLDDPTIDTGSRGITTLYYAASDFANPESALLLNGDGRGPINAAVILSNVAPSLAPSGQALISASSIGISELEDGELDDRARAQLGEWFGVNANHWRLLRVYRIPNFVPDLTAGKRDPWQRPVRIRPGLYVCGDHRDNGTFDGAMSSGFRAAQAAMEDLHALRT